MRIAFTIWIICKESRPWLGWRIELERSNSSKHKTVLRRSHMHAFCAGCCVLQISLQILNSDVMSVIWHQLNIGFSMISLDHAKVVCASQQLKMQQRRVYQTCYQTVADQDSDHGPTYFKTYSQNWLCPWTLLNWGAQWSCWLTRICTNTSSIFSHQEHYCWAQQPWNPEVQKWWRAWSSSP